MGPARGAVESAGVSVGNVADALLQTCPYPCRKPESLSGGGWGAAVARLCQVPAPVGIAEAAAPKKRIPLSSRKESCRKKVVPEAGPTGLGLEKGGWKPVGPSGRKFVLGGPDWW